MTKSTSYTDLIKPSYSWQPCNDYFYRKLEVFDMEWNVDLSNLVVAVANFGGLIATIRNDKKLQITQLGATRPSISVWTSRGDLVGSFLWEKSRIVGMGWTETEKLMIVCQDATLYLADAFGPFAHYTLGVEDGILECQFSSSGLVALTSSYNFVTVQNIDEVRPRILDAGLKQVPYSWNIIPQSKNLEILMSVDKTLISLDSNGPKDQRLDRGPFLHMSYAPNNKFLALFTSSNKLWVVSTDFQKSLTEFQASNLPTSIAWIGSDAVALITTTESTSNIQVVAPFGETVEYSWDETIAWQSEVDGLRILSSQCEFLQKVPLSTEKIFKIGSTSPGAVLFDALEQFEKQSPKADDLIRTIRPELVDAVDMCTEASGNEMDAKLSQALLKAASFGKTFLDGYNADKFVSMVKAVRVMNQVKQVLGMPLTHAQHLRLGDALIDRMIGRREFLLALKISEFMELPGDKVLVAWAVAKIRRGGDQDQLAKQLTDHLSSYTSRYPGICFADMAKEAFRQGMPRLATRLLQLEPVSSNQVPLLISMNQDEEALDRAIDSGDTDLVYLVLLHLLRTHAPAQVFAIISKRPMASNLFQKYARQVDRNMLQDFYYQEDLRNEGAHLELTRAAPTGDEALTHLRNATKLFGQDKERSWEASATEDEIKLRLLQDGLEKEVNQAFVGCSLTETLMRLLLGGFNTRANKIKSEWKIGEKKWFWLRLRAVCQLKDWEGLARLMKEKSPIGYAPIVEELLRVGAKQEAGKYLDKVDNAELRQQLAIRIQ